MSFPEGTEEGGAVCSPTDTRIDVVTNRFARFRIFRCGRGTCPAWNLRLVYDDGTVNLRTLHPTDPDLARAVWRLVEETPQLAPLKNSIWLKRMVQQ